MLSAKEQGSVVLELLLFFAIIFVLGLALVRFVHWELGTAVINRLP